MLACVGNALWGNEAKCSTAEVWYFNVFPPFTVYLLTTSPDWTYLVIFIIYIYIYILKYITYNIDYLHIDTHTHIYIYIIYICIYAYIVYIRLLRRAWQRSLRKFDPFEILDVTPQSSASQIKRAYRKLSLNYHPEPWRKAGERLWGDTDLLGPTFCTKSGLMIKKTPDAREENYWTLGR